jgi:hypothetical protein
LQARGGGPFRLIEDFTMIAILKTARPLALWLAVIMAWLSVQTTPSYAGIVPTDRAIADIIGQPGERGRVMEFLAREDVRQQMIALGVDPNEAMLRAQALGDDEIGRIAGELDRLPAGQDALGAVVAAVVIIFLVLLLTDILGLTRVFPFTRSSR